MPEIRSPGYPFIILIQVIDHRFDSPGLMNPWAGPVDPVHHPVSLIHGIFFRKIIPKIPVNPEALNFVERHLVFILIMF
jgi:hypothetical protein